MSDGSPAAILLEAAVELGQVIKTISAIRSLGRRWTPILRAKRAICNDPAAVEAALWLQPEPPAGR